MRRVTKLLLGLATGLAAGALVGLPTYQVGLGEALGAIVGLAAGAKWREPPDVVAGACSGVVLGWLFGKTIHGLALIDAGVHWPVAISLVVFLLGLAGPVIAAVLDIASALVLPKVIDGRAPRAIGTSVVCGLVMVVLLLSWPQVYADECGEAWQKQYLQGLTTDGTWVFIEAPDYVEWEEGIRELARGESYSFSTMGLDVVRYEVMAVGPRGAHVLFTRSVELSGSSCIARISTESGSAQRLPSLLPLLNPGTTPGSASAPTDVLVVRGRVFANPLGSEEPVSVRAELEPAFVFPDQPVPDRPLRGEYEIVMRDAAGHEMARTPFYAPSARSLEEGFPAFEERIAFVPGTAQIEIQRTVALASLRPGEAAPTVRLLSPNGGEVLTDLPIRVAWEANDPDGDELSFIVEYSLDGGDTWGRPAEWPVKGDHLEIPILDTPDLVATRGLFRVWASDGIHTAQDESDATFRIPDPLPLAVIDRGLLPEVLALQQTLELRAAYLVRLNNDEGGSVDAGQIEWFSDLDGFLGNGKNLAVLLQHTGRHTITLRVTDPAGNLATDTAAVEVVPEPSDLPPSPDLLLVGPDLLSLDPRSGITTDIIWIDNLNFERSIPWSASVSDPWILLGHRSGTTPDEISVTYDPSLPQGQYWGAITIEQPDHPEDRVIIQIGIDLSED